MFLLERHRDWFSLWFWPIGFGVTMIIGLLLSLVWQTARDRQRTSLTYWEVMRRDAEPEQLYGANDEIS
jgi:hypothetical protein